MINWETIKSLYNDKPTLLQWLKKVEATLAASVLQVVDVEKVSTSEIKLNFIFEDGTNIETPTIALPYEIQSVAIINGHLILTLESGETLDAGNLGAVSSFSINAAQHLIVTYQDGTTQDLGAIFTGNVNIAGNFTADSIIENMNGYSFQAPVNEKCTQEVIYAGIVKNGNKLTAVVYEKVSIDADNTNDYFNLGSFNIPSSVAGKLYPTEISGAYFLDNRKISFVNALSVMNDIYGFAQKGANSIDLACYGIQALTKLQDYYVRYEVTFLLSENLAA